MRQNTRKEKALFGNARVIARARRLFFEARFSKKKKKIVAYF